MRNNPATSNDRTGHSAGIQATGDEGNSYATCNNFFGGDAGRGLWVRMSIAGSADVTVASSKGPFEHVRKRLISLSPIGRAPAPRPVLKTPSSSAPWALGLNSTTGRLARSIEVNWSPTGGLSPPSVAWVLGFQPRSAAVGVSTARSRERRARVGVGPQAQACTGDLLRQTARVNRLAARRPTGS